METKDFGREKMETKPLASIRLEFFRHDEKGKAAEGQPDTTVRLTPKGRVDATNAGKPRNPEPEVGVAFGSSRERSIETSMRQMLANKESVGPDSTLEDIREIIADKVQVGRKDMVDARLNFEYENTPEYKTIFLQAYSKDKRGLDFLIHESDELVRRLGDLNDTSYTRQAGNIASLIKKYLEILPNWQRIAADNPEKYAKFNNEMQRFMVPIRQLQRAF